MSDVLCSGKKPKTAMSFFPKKPIGKWLVALVIVARVAQIARVPAFTEAPADLYQQPRSTPPPPYTHAHTHTHTPLLSRLTHTKATVPASAVRISSLTGKKNKSSRPAHTCDAGKATSNSSSSSS
jgi:hypothetical protein